MVGANDYSPTVAYLLIRPSSAHPGPHPLILSLSKDALPAGGWFDKLTMSGRVVGRLV